MKQQEPENPVVEFAEAAYRRAVASRIDARVALTKQAMRGATDNATAEERMALLELLVHAKSEMAGPLLDQEIEVEEQTRKVAGSKTPTARCRTLVKMASRLRRKGK